MELDELFVTLTHGAASLLAPDSLLVEDASTRELERSTIEELSAAQKASECVIPGDIILITSPGPFYAFCRGVCNSYYDHAAVVLDATTVLHIGPPLARRMQLLRVLLPKRQPTIFRPALDNVQRAEFIASIAALEGSRYDLTRAYGLMLRLTLKHFKLTPLPSMAPLAPPFKAWICTDAIIFALANCCPAFLTALSPPAASSPSRVVPSLSQKEDVHQSLVGPPPSLDLHQLGSFTFNDFATVRHVFPSLLTRQMLPTALYTTRPPRTVPWLTLVQSLHHAPARASLRRHAQQALVACTARWSDVVCEEYEAFQQERGASLYPHHSPRTKARLVIYLLVLMLLVKKRAWVSALCTRTAQVLLMKKILTTVLERLAATPNPRTALTLSKL